MKRILILFVLISLFITSCHHQECTKYAEKIECESYFERTYPCPTKELIIEPIQSINLSMNYVNNKNHLDNGKYIATQGYFEFQGSCMPYELELISGNVSEKKRIVLENSTTEYYTVQEYCLQNRTVLYCVEWR